MSVGTLFFLLALVLFFLLGIGLTPVPRLEYWAWFAMVLGFLTTGFPLLPLR